MFLSYVNSYLTSIDNFSLSHSLPFLRYSTSNFSGFDLDLLPSNVISGQVFVSMFLICLYFVFSCPSVVVYIGYYVVCFFLQNSLCMLLLSVLSENTCIILYLFFALLISVVLTGSTACLHKLT